MKKVVVLFSLIVGLLASATLQAQVNMSRYITLTVDSGEDIKLDFKAAAAGTPVRIVSGSNTQDITAGTNWYNGSNPSTFTVTANGTEMKVYGDIVAFRCNGNQANLTALDLSNNTQLTELDCSYNRLTSLDVSNNAQLKTLWCVVNQLTSLDVSNCTQLKELYCNTNQLTALDVSNNTKLTHINCSNNKLSSLDVSNNTQLWWLYCHDNNFSTQALDDIFCALPNRTGTINGVILPVKNSSAPNHATVLATNKTNATSKNWKVQYFDGNTDIPATTGSYTCPTNMSRYITLTVGSGESIKLDFKAASANTPVRIVSGSNTQDITVGTNWYNGSNPSTFTVTADGTEMKVYGDIVAFRCSDNQANLTALDVSNNTQLTTLYCNTNKLTTLDLSNNTQLTTLYCNTNKLTTLDLSNNTQLTTLYCNTNKLTALDLSNNTQLVYLYCYSNKLTTLDVSNNTKLWWLYCHDNNFSTQALDDIFCALPNRTGTTNGVILPVKNSSAPNHATVLATNKTNATAKNWKVQYFDGNTDIPATTGSYMCYVEYDLKIAGVQVTSTNCSDLSVISGVSGTVKYDPSTNVLTLENATIQIDTTSALFSKIDGLTIKVIGTNTLTTGNRTTLLLTKSLTITGGGVLNVNSGGNCAIYVYGTNLTIDGCTVNAKGGYGIVGRNDSNDKLIIKNSTVTAEGTGGSIADLAGLTLDGCAITQPAGAAFDASLHAVALNGEKVTSKVVISKISTDIAEATAEQALTLYPNPVADVLYLSATARTIRIYNVYGTEVAHATDTDKVEVSHLPAGIYTVKADGMVAKMVKR